MAKYRTAALAALIAAVFAAPSFAAGSIAIRQKAEVADRVVLMSDIADISGLPKEETAKIASLEFCTAPQPNAETSLNDKQIKGKLHNAGINLDKYQLKLPKKLTIRRKATVVTGRSVVEGGVEWLQKSLPWKGVVIEMDGDKAPQDVVLPFGDARVEYSADLDESKYGIQNFQAAVTQGGRKVRVITLSAYIKVMGRTTLAARDIAAGEALTADALTYGVTDLSKLRAGAYSDVSELTGKQAARPIKSGDMITKSMVDKTPDIKSGDIVKLVYRKGGLEITGQGKALHKGYIGETTEAMNTQTKKLIRGVIIDKNTVEISGN